MKALKLAYNKPESFWYTSYSSYGLKRAESIARHYNASIEHEPYAIQENSWFYYIFKGEYAFEDLMQFIYDHKTGQFQKTFGKNL